MRKLRLLLPWMCAALVVTSNSTACADEPPAVADRPDVAAIKAVVREYYERYVQQDFEGVTALLLPSSPWRLSYEYTTLGVFAATASFELKGLEIPSVEIDAEGSAAIVRVTRAISIQPAKRRSPTPAVVDGPRVLRLQREEGDWKVWYVGDEQGLASEFEEHRQPVAANRPEAAAIKALIRGYLAAYVAEDLDGVLGFWMADSPHLAEWKKRLEERFAEYDDFQLRGGRVDFVKTFDAGTFARSVVYAYVTHTEVESGKLNYDDSFKETFQFRKIDGRWRIWNILPVATEVADWLAGARTYRERQARLREVEREYGFLWNKIPDEEYRSSHRESHLAMFLASALTRIDDAARRKQLIREEPVLTEDIISVRHLLWVGFLTRNAEDARDPKTLKDMLHAADIAEELALECNSVTALVLCYQARGILLEWAGRYDESLEWLTRAKTLTERHQLLQVDQWKIVDLFVNLVHLGRVHVKLENSVKAQQVFYTASKYYDIIKRLEDRFDRYSLGRQYLNRLKQRDRTVEKVGAFITKGDLESAILQQLDILDAEVSVYGLVHIEVAGSHEWLARMHALLGRSDEAQNHARLYDEIAAQLPGTNNGNIRWGEWLKEHVERVARLSAEERQPLAEAYALWQTADEFYQKQDYKQAIPLWQRVVEIYAKVLSEDDFLLARSRRYLAMSLRKVNDSAAAEPLFELAAPVYARVVGLHEGTDSPHVNWFGTMVRLAYHHLDRGEFETAVKWRNKAIGMVEQYWGVDSESAKKVRPGFHELDRIVKLTPEGLQEIKQAHQWVRDAAGLMRQGSHADAAETAERAVAVFRRLTGDESRFSFEAQYVLGACLFLLGRQGDAERVFQTLRNHPRPRRGYKFQLLRTLGAVVGSQNRFVEAEQIAAESVGAARSEHGFRSAQHAGALSSHAHYLAALGRYEQAKRVMRTALVVQKQLILPPEHEHFSDEKMIYDFGEKELSGKTLRGSAPHRQYAELLGDYANVARYTPGFDRQLAIRMLSAALRLFMEVDGTDRTNDYNRKREHLADLYVSMGRYAEALVLYEAKIAYLEEEHKQKPPSVFGMAALAGNYHGLAKCYGYTGRLEEAAPLLEEAAELYANSHGESYHLYADVMQNSTWVAFARKRYAEALDFENRHLNIRQQILRAVLQDASESVMRSFAERVPDPTNLLQMAAAVPPEFRDRFVRAAYDWTLRRRAIVTESLCRIRDRERAMAADPEVRELALNLRKLRQQLNKLQITPPQNLTGLELRQERERVQKEVDTVETDLNASLTKAAGATVPTTQLVEVSAELVGKRLPASTVVVEFVRFPAYDFGAKRGGKDRFYAFVATAGEKPSIQFVDLCDAAEIDNLVRRYRDTVDSALRSYRRTPSEDLPLEEADWVDALRGSSQSLYDVLIAKLKDAAGDAQTWYIVPEGELNRLPFEALVDPDGKYFVESTRVAYLNSGRDLLRPDAERAAEGTVIFAGADFDLDPSRNFEQREEVLAALGTEQTVALRGPTSNGVRGMRWPKIDATLVEGKEIGELLEGSNYGPVRAYLGAQALEDVLKLLPAPRVLHLATHGFFLPDVKRPDDDGPVDDGAAAGFSRLRQAENPLLRSGIVLSGANALGATHDGDDGWVTAQEVALLNLHGTELVVLSACNSGLGRIETGEGVQGLRVAFRYAGAKTLISTLFEVPDGPTQRLMLEFYRRLKAGETKLDALRNAQRTIIAERRKAHDAAHPLFWGSFVLVGEVE